MNYSFHPGAQQDITDAQDFYLQQAGVRVATRFLDELQHVITLLRQHPGLGTPSTKSRRVFPLKTFPYSVVYRVQVEHLYILVVRHQHRHPSYARDRH
jgi:plasmid stabilization system protein ParE